MKARLELDRSESAMTDCVRKTALLVLAAPATTLAADYASPYGEWRGETQYQAFVRGVADPAAHVVTNLTIAISPGGKVSGSSAENGCRVVGLATPGIAPAIVNLSVTLTGCNYPGLNRTYAGDLSVFGKERYAKFSLQAIDTISGKGGTYNITSTMRR